MLVWTKLSRALTTFFSSVVNVFEKSIPFAVSALFLLETKFYVSFIVWVTLSENFRYPSMATPTPLNKVEKDEAKVENRSNIL